VDALLVVHALALGAASLLFATLIGSPRRGWPLLVAGGLLVGPVATTGLALLWTVPGGAPALVGTRHGRLLLGQAALLALAIVVFAAVVRRARRSHPRGLAGWLALQTALALAMTLLAGVLLARPFGGAEPIVWPFHVRFAPAVTWSAASVRDQVMVGGEIVVMGCLALLLAYRVRNWRPLLLAAGVGLSVLGVYKALSAMTIDAYPTTYARSPVPATQESVRRGRELFAVHCAPCHGATGRGDGPAAAGLLQRPADLAASHTADHTPGDIYWWLTHGLGLAMPAFEDRLSTAERWQLVHFVRTLSAGGR
jgi:putative copper resistance protein D